MKCRLILLVFPILACTVLSTPPSTLPPDSVISSPQGTNTSSPPTQPPPPSSTDIPPPNTPLNATTFPDPNAFSWQLIASGLERPVDLQSDDSGRLFLIEKPGRIRIIENGQLLAPPPIDINDRVNDNSNEMGLLGLALHPDFAQNGFFYVNYTGDGGDTFISRFTASGDTADPNSELILLTVGQPFPNHNGGGLDFGPDGFLYIGLGDGGAAGDPFGN